MKTKNSQPFDLESMNKLADEIMEMFCVVDDRPYPEGTGIWGMDTELFSTDENETARSKARKKIITKIKQRLKSACEFYLRYKDKPILLHKEKEKYRKLIKDEWLGIPFDEDEYNDWLFKLAFKWEKFKEKREGIWKK